MGVGQNGDAVGADLVGGVAVGGDPVGPDDDHLNLAFPHHLGGHVVADQSDGDAAALELPGGQPGTLEQRPGLVGKDMHGRALLMGGEDHGEGGAVIGGCQAAGVAVRQNAVPRPDQRCPEPADCAAHRAVFLVDVPGLRRAAFRGAARPSSRSIRGQAALHAVDAQNRLTAVGRLVRSEAAASATARRTAAPSWKPCDRGTDAPPHKLPRRRWPALPGPATT